MAGFRPLVIVLVAWCREVPLVVSSSSESSCTSEPSAEQGGSLLQTRSSRASRSSDLLLSEALGLLGIETFGSKDALDKIIDESQLVNISYAGVPLSLRFLAKDNAAWRLGQKLEDGSDYGLDSLLEMRHSDKDMVNMIDMGANNGLVTIAVYNKYPGLVRAVITEPVPATYFFMRWNMFLNKVPYLEKKEFARDSKKPGVAALHAGVTKKAKDLHMCSHPEWSMNAFDQSQGTPSDFGGQKFIHKGEGSCDCGEGFTCTVVPGISANNIFDDYFGEETVTLLKMDCEGCEYYALPALMERPDRLKRLVGELHMPEEQFIDMSCKYDSGKYMTKVCKTGEAEWKSSLSLDCGKERQVCNPCATLKQWC